MVAPISLDSPTEEGSNASASPPKKPNLPSSKSAPGSSSLLSPPTVSIIAPTPVASPTESPRRTVSDSAASHGLGTPPSSKSIGKRKAEDVEVMSAVPKHVHHPSFVLPMPERCKSIVLSSASRAPSAFHTPKRARLSSPSHSPSGSRQGSINRVPKGSWSSQTSSKVHGMAPSRAPSTRSNSTPAHITNDVDHRRSLSQASIPVHAIVMPHVPSISRSSTYHMRDPRRPPKIQPTPWSLRLPSEEEDGSPIHAWIFFIGFLLFPIWWVASFLPIPRTRQMGGTDTEKAVTLDDPQIEHDARIWRRRCRIMAFVSLFTYIPFIVLVAVFVSRRP
ncbi:hypothetical protein OE88DRAFT_1634181 [Heliocybe sulcata]|uniref:Uncharacterized protein n=1 Tax=Heliocybe sulcata TaxID=5364 RepID=A0A5C3MV00_9AGAM|nr:hypothetical protein OE88DRAFT_1634181 [Heliocybe sulcata]